MRRIADTIEDMTRVGIVTFSLLLVVIWSAFGVRGQEVETRFVYRGTADASAGIALSDDTFVVGSDESLFVPKHLKKGENVLFVYKVGTSQPLYTVRLESILRSGDSNNEADIEAAARIGNRIFWISSHGHNAEGKSRPDRFNFFATDIDDKGKLGLSGGKRPLLSYKNLLIDLIDDNNYAKFDLGKLHRSAIAPKRGGVNIEGMAAAPNGHLLIGFRSPIVDGKALIAPLTNPNDVVTQAKRAIFDEPVELDLGGLGIRDIVFWQKGKCFLIIGGPVGEEGTSWLYRWDGNVSDDGIATPQRLENIDFNGLNPEAIVIYPNSDKIQILSDDGAKMITTEKGKIVENKSLRDNSRTFRSVWIKL